jgi:hypothetical protein
VNFARYTIEVVKFVGWLKNASAKFPNPRLLNGGQVNSVECTSIRAGRQEQWKEKFLVHLKELQFKKKVRGRGLGRGEFVRFTVDVAPEREVALLCAAVKRWALGHRLLEFLGAE